MKAAGSAAVNQRRFAATPIVHCAAVLWGD
jgi:hypothetical protein